MTEPHDLPDWIHEDAKVAVPHVVQLQPMVVNYITGTVRKITDTQILVEHVPTARGNTETRYRRKDLAQVGDRSYASITLQQLEAPHVVAAMVRDRCRIAFHRITQSAGQCANPADWENWLDDAIGELSKAERRVQALRERENPALSRSKWA